MKKIIFKAIEVEIEISFPYITKFECNNAKKIYFNYEDKKCILLDCNNNSISHLSYNYGLEYDQISQNEFHSNYGAILQFYFDIFNNN